MYKIFLAFFLCTSFSALAQPSDSLTISRISDEIFTNSRAYENLRFICKKIGPRLSGSKGAAQAVEATAKMLRDAGADKVTLQPCNVPFWERGGKETGYVVTKLNKRVPIKITALGNVVGTSTQGLSAPIVLVNSMEELKAVGHAVKGKIVFFNIKMTPKYVETFEAYSKDGVARRRGPAEASRYGAVGVIVRSLASNVDDYPHTGVTRYNDSFPKIPAVAISTADAEMLSKMVQQGEVKSVYIKSNAVMHEKKVPSYNVIGEIIGTEFPDEIITVGGHLDSWDLAEGAHDDGAGCVQSIEIIRTLKALGIKPKRTIRAVMFMNEENGSGGADAYYDSAVSKKEKHIFALESDAGGFTPRGFSFDCTAEKFAKLQQWKPLFYRYGVYDFSKGGSGADIGDLKKIGAALSGLRPDSQRYFDVHHAASDVFEAVSKRELDLGTVNMAAMIWLVSEYGL